MILKDPENIIVIDPDLTLLKEVHKVTALCIKEASSNAIRAGISHPLPSYSKYT